MGDVGCVLVQACLRGNFVQDRGCEDPLPSAVLQAFPNSSPASAQPTT